MQSCITTTHKIDSIRTWRRFPMEPSHSPTSRRHHSCHRSSQHSRSQEFIRRSTSRPVREPLKTIDEFLHRLKQPLANTHTRPAQRGFFRRLGSRIMNPYSEVKNIRAIRMPRKEYLRHHKFDSEGNYVGTEPQQDWDDEMIEACYGQYQHKPLNSLYNNAVARI